jgi:hypothetical protein
MLILKSPLNFTPHAPVGMLSTLDKYCLQTVDEIHAAAVTAAAKGKLFLHFLHM